MSGGIGIKRESGVPLSIHQQEIWYENYSDLSESDPNFTLWNPISTDIESLYGDIRDSYKDACALFKHKMSLWQRIRHGINLRIDVSNIYDDPDYNLAIVKVQWKMERFGHSLREILKKPHEFWYTNSAHHLQLREESIEDYLGLHLPMPKLWHLMHQHILEWHLDLRPEEKFDAWRQDFKNLFQRHARVQPQQQQVVKREGTSVVKREGRSSGHDAGDDDNDVKITRVTRIDDPVEYFEEGSGGALGVKRPRFNQAMNEGNPYHVEFGF